MADYRTVCNRGKSLHCTLTSLAVYDLNILKSHGSYLSIRKYIKTITLCIDRMKCISRLLIIK